MRTTSWDRFAAGGGLISVLFFVVAWFVYGNGPKTSDESEVIFRFFADHRDRVLWCLLIQGLGALAMVWFMAALVIAMKDANELLWAVSAALSFILALSLGSSATMLRLGVAFVAGAQVDVDTVAALFRLGHILDTSQNVISAGSYLTVAIVAIRTGFIPAWWGWASAIAAGWALISTTAWNLGGFWSPDGAGFVNLVFYIAWVGGTSLLLLTRAAKGADRT